MSRPLEPERETLMDLFHRHRQANEPEQAAAVLERALQIPAYKGEAYVWKGIAALPQSPHLAFLFFGNAAALMPDRADVHALVGRSLLAQGEAGLATRYLANAWRKQPNEAAIRMTLWQARGQSETPAELLRLIMAHLPDIHSGQELAFVLKLLSQVPDAPSKVGVVRYLHEQREIHGWVIDLAAPDVPVAVGIEVDGKRFNLTASAPHSLLTAAGFPATHGGLRVSLPTPNPAVHFRTDDGVALLGSPVYAMPPFVPPSPAGGGGLKQPVDVLIPVYDGLEETLACIKSVLEARKRNRTPHRLVVVNDCSPVPALTKALNVLAGKGKITLLSNPVNLGFIRTMNRAMAVSPNKDVVWLNADTRVHGDWLDRLREVAYSDPKAASVTPFTNNGELMSFPESRVSHPMPDAKAHAELDELASELPSEPVELETGCGFCLYIKRAALDEVGYLDDVHLARGYGEETDWCLRARSQGWRHLGAPRVFVAHQGGVSFGIEKTLRVAHNNAVLRERYPDASARYDVFCLRDPIKPARQALECARLAVLAKMSGNKRFSYWRAIFDPIGTHMNACSIALVVQEEPDGSAPFVISWRSAHQRSWATLHVGVGTLPMLVDFELPAEYNALLTAVRLLPITQILLANSGRCPELLRSLPEELNMQGASDYPLEGQRDAATPKHVPTLDRLPGITLIGDALSSVADVTNWLALARSITAASVHTVLIAPRAAPWMKSLWPARAVHLLPSIPDFTSVECAKAAGVDGVLTISRATNGLVNAQHWSADLNVPLFTYAPTGGQTPHPTPDEPPISLLSPA